MARPTRTTPIPTSLYRIYADDGELLYIGISANIVRRFANHRQWRDWWWQASRIDLEHFNTAAAAEDAERRAILTERPTHNVQHNSDYARAKGGA